LLLVANLKTLVTVLSSEDSYEIVTASNEKFQLQITHNSKLSITTVSHIQAKPVPSGRGGGGGKKKRRLNKTGKETKMAHQS
jgi:hypothetical protein